MNPLMRCKTGIPGLDEILCGGFIAERMYLVDGNPGQILNQAIGVLISVALATVGTFVILKVCDVLIGVRVDHDAEEQGLDLSQHGEEGYSLEA